jgi:nucleoside permease NupC
MRMLQPVIGLFVLISLAWVTSENRSGVSYRTVVVGIGLQIFFAILSLKLPASREIFRCSRMECRRCKRRRMREHF